MGGCFVTIMKLVIYCSQEEIESSLRLVHAVATGATGALCVTHRYGRLRAPLHASRWDSARARADLAANFLQQLGLDTVGEFILPFVFSLSICFSLFPTNAPIVGIAE